MTAFADLPHARTSIEIEHAGLKTVYTVCMTDLRYGIATYEVACDEYHVRRQLTYADLQDALQEADGIIRSRLELTRERNARILHDWSERARAAREDLKFE